MLSRPQALFLLAAAGLLIGWSLLIATGGPGLVAAAAPTTGPTDVELYERIVRRVHAGEGYYDAAGAELSAGGYPTRSPFNWRLPVYAWLLGALPDPDWGQAVLAGLMLFAVLASYGVLSATSGRGGAAAGALLLGLALLPSVGSGGHYFSELWAGTLIALSIAATAGGRWRAGVAAGLAALLLRELALPFVVVSLGLAWWHGRRAEAWAWLIGLAGFALGLAAHAAVVLARVSAADRAFESGWVQGNGLPFLLDTAHIHPVLFALPAWVTAVSLPLVLLALVVWRGELGRRVGLTVLIYVAAFAVVGFRFNTYWGYLYVPLLSLGAARVPLALRDLGRALGRPEPRPAAAPV